MSVSSARELLAMPYMKAWPAGQSTHDGWHICEMATMEVAESMINRKYYHTVSRI